jgi:hypothetical protein
MHLYYKEQLDATWGNNLSLFWHSHELGGVWGTQIFVSVKASGIYYHDLGMTIDGVWIG